jgi:hypothetical protein
MFEQAENRGKAAALPDRPELPKPTNAVRALPCKPPRRIESASDPMPPHPTFGTHLNGRALEALPCDSAARLMAGLRDTISRSSSVRPAADAATSDLSEFFTPALRYAS